MREHTPAGTPVAVRLAPVRGGVVLEVADAGPGMSAEQPFTSGDCGRTSAAFDPPLVLAAGDSVAVTLGYDLATSIVAGAPGQGYTIQGATIDGAPHYFRACEDIDADHRVCMDYPDFVPSAAKQ